MFSCWYNYCFSPIHSSLPCKLILTIPHLLINFFSWLWFQLYIYSSNQNHQQEMHRVQCKYSNFQRNLWHLHCRPYLSEFSSLKLAWVSSFIALSPDPQNCIWLCMRRKHFMHMYVYILLSSLWKSYQWTLIMCSGCLKSIVLISDFFTGTIVPFLPLKHWFLQPNEQFQLEALAAAGFCFVITALILEVCSFFTAWIVSSQ